MQLICAREQYLFGEGTCASTPTNGSGADNSEVIEVRVRTSEVIEVRVRTSEVMPPVA